LISGDHRHRLRRAAENGPAGLHGS
jgi:hypothetical protein